MPSLRQTRLATGLILFVYVTLHFANHALGNISVGAMESGLAIQKLIWRSLPGAVILYVSLLTHMSLGFWMLYERRQFRWTRLEAGRLAERRLPFDTVFIINQFLNAVSHAVLDAGGEPNQVLGDGLLALFGMGDPPEVACRQAIAASAAIAARVERLNSALSHALVEPIRFGVGIHAGVTIAGAIGYERHAQFTVIGDPVNVAARLEALTKILGCEVLMSEEVYERAGFGPDDLPVHDVEARGREDIVKARSVARAADLARLIPAEAPVS